ncbi:hypothetical protein DCAR_0205511 [Daucus carota subsp. sativus]|uniref:Sphingomyelin phosphodiesterase 4 n=1 Tax=Daucus carota subsp. sativus TaxID=79200 RepID=A0A166CNU5_DAUCS|nr:PREDICTED: uncharacterized protein LOC108205828 [Daucus carota subsp. sativus]WOG86309.1 hypothetical protein DCAR_0205511 [Daucus carota subsp. sativus]
MLSHTYATDSQTKSAELAATIAAATSPAQIADACAAVESFLAKRTPEQNKFFFTTAFPTLICKLFGFEDAPSSKPNGWTEIIANCGDSELNSKVFNFLSPNSVLISSIFAADRLSQVKYVFPTERLPEWMRFMFRNEREVSVLSELCPLFRGRVSSNAGCLNEVRLNVFEYYMFWFAYYPVCKGNSESFETVKAPSGESKRFRFENWAYSIPVFSQVKRGGGEPKSECSLYVKLLYAYLREYVTVGELSSYQPYRSSLLHYSGGCDDLSGDKAEFVVYTLMHFWLVDNDFSPLPVNVCKSFGVNFSFRSVLGETPPTAGLGEIVNVFVKYLNLISMNLADGSDKVASIESPRWGKLGGGGVVKSGDVGNRSVGSWNALIKRPLYRFILRTFIYCPMETSIKNASQVFSLWINYIEPWNISSEDFSGLDVNAGVSSNGTKKEVQSSSSGYSSSWQGFVLINYLFYSSLVMHFLGFAHKFLHTDTEAIVQMVSKVLSILTSSRELINLIKNVDTVFHSKPSGSSKPMHNNLYRFVPSIREQLQDWEDGLCENDADGSFLHENWNKDLQLFSDGDDGGQQLLQLFVLRAESELQTVLGDNHAHNMACLDSIKAQMGCLFGNSTPRNTQAVPETRENQHPRDEIFSPRMIRNKKQTGTKYRGDWLKRPVSNDEIAWLAKLLVTLSCWLNEKLGLNQSGTTDNQGAAWSYVEVSGGTRSVNGPADTMKVVFLSVVFWLISVIRATVKLMRDHGMKVNLRILASKKIMISLLMLVAFSILKKAVSPS